MMGRSVMGCGWCAAALVVACSPSAGQEWTRFRGPNGTGIGKAPDLPVRFTEADFRWKVKLPEAGHSSPVLWGEKIFLTCSPARGTQRQVVCLRAGDGAILWTRKDTFSPYRQNRLNSFAASTPAVDAERVYLSWVSGSDYIVLALDHAGKLVWRRTLGDFKAKHGAGASPAVYEGVVLAGNTHRGQQSALFGLDAKTGKTLWKHDCKSGPTSYITPMIYQGTGGKAEAVFVSSSHGVTSVDPRTGKVLWEAGGPFRLKSVASPVLAGGLIFVSAGQGGSARESAAVRPPKAGGKVEVAYRLGRFVPYVPTPIAVDGLLYVPSDRARLTCVDPATGKTLWEHRMSGIQYPSPVSVGGRIYCINTKGEVTVLAAGRTAKVLATFTLPEGTHATPAIAHGRMYIRTFHHLICVGGKD